MRPCLRCDWRPDQDAEAAAHAQLLEHAEATGHPLCVVCHRSLTEAEPRTCEKCLTKVREHLVEIVELYALLPEQLGHPAAQVYDRDGRGGGDGAPLPGGAVLVMLGPGGTGTEPRRLTTQEQLLGVEGREHGWDNLESDGTAVVFLLHHWEIYWGEVRREPAPTGPETLASSAGYLERRMRWAADHLELFPEFAAELRSLRTHMQATTGRSDRPVRAPAVCFRCGEDALERKWGDTGLEEDWTCARCHRVYKQEEYFLAVRAHLEGAPPTPQRDRRVPTCPTCGLTRCPHAWHPRYRCTASDARGQEPRLAPRETG